MAIGRIGRGDQLERPERLVLYIRRGVSIVFDCAAQDLIEYTLLMAFLALATAALFIGAGGSVKGIWTRNSDTGVTSPLTANTGDRTLDIVLQRPASQETEAALKRAFDSLNAANTNKSGACFVVLAALVELRQTNEFGRIAMARELSRELSERGQCTPGISGNTEPAFPVTVAP